MVDNTFEIECELTNPANGESGKYKVSVQLVDAKKRVFTFSNPRPLRFKTDNIHTLHISIIAIKDETSPTFVSFQSADNSALPININSDSLVQKLGDGLLNAIGYARMFGES